jgi:hypothetical protein
MKEMAVVNNYYTLIPLNIDCATGAIILYLSSQKANEFKSWDNKETLGELMFVKITPMYPIRFTSSHTVQLHSTQDSDWMAKISLYVV